MINRKWVCPSFNFIFRFRFIYYVLSLNNSKFWWLYADRIYPIALEKRDTTDTVMSATYHGLHQEIDSDSRFKTKPYYKRDVFDFPILIFPCIYNNTPVAPTYLVHIDVIHLYICQLITGPRAFASYQHFLDRGQLRRRRLLNQECLLVTGQYFTVAIMIWVSVSQITKDMFRLL